VRILLVKPRARLGTVRGLEAFQLLEPIELGYLAAAVGDDHTVRILDLRLHRRHGRAFTAALERFRPDVVGFTGYSHEASAVKALAGVVRASIPDAFIVVGGHHATVAPKDLDVPQIDAVVRGEGCGPFRALVDALANGADVEGIPHVLRPGEGWDAEAATAWPTFPDPATLPVPRRDLWDPASYRSVWAAEQMPAWERIFPPVSMVRASWGCRMKCTFCVVPFLCGGEHRPRPADWVAEEIAGAPADHIYFCDDENFIDEEFALELADALERRGVRKRYFAWTRATTVLRSPELFRRWRAIGLDAAFLGFEFTDDTTLREHKKATSVRANEQALDRLRELGVAVHAAFMLQPEFTEAQFGALREYVRRLPPAQCSFTVCTPSPGTPDYEATRAEMWVDNPYDLHDCMHPLTPTTLPLRRFAELYAEQVAEGVRKTPLRANHHPLRPGDLWRVIRAERRYLRGYRTLHEDYPRELWRT